MPAFPHDASRHKVTYHSCQGFSLTKSLVVIFVIGLPAALAFLIVYANIVHPNKANAERAYLDTITACVENLYAEKSSYQDLDNARANQARCFPAGMNNGDYKAGVIIVNSWGGAVTLRNSLVAGPTHFEVIFEGIPDSDCIKLTSAVTGNYEFVSINGTIVKDHEDLAGEGVVSFDPGTVGRLCVATKNTLLITTQNKRKQLN